MSECGVKFDGQGGNIFYDTEAGFSALDIEPLGTNWAGSWPHALMKQIEHLTRTTSSDLLYAQEVDRISAIVEDIFAEERVEGAALDRLKRARERIADTIERLEMFEDYYDVDDTFYDWNEYTE